MAFWFASFNSYLGGGLPKEVLQTDFGIVLDAARDEGKRCYKVIWTAC